VDFSRAWQFLSTLVAALCLASVGLFAPAQAAVEGLTGTVWQLVQFQSGNGQSLRPDGESAYTVEFKTDNTLVVRLDCYRGRGTWLSRATSQLELGPLGLTRGKCPQSALSDQIPKQWTFVRSYVVRDTHLFLSLMADGGTYEFEPGSAPAPAASPPQAVTQVPGQATARAPTPEAPQAPTQAATTRSAASAAPRSWLDESKPVAWNTPGAVLPSAPKVEGTIDPRCGTLTRPAELEADKRLSDLGWNLIGAYQGGWDVLVIQGTAGYDGMCRPRTYQFFVFYRGVFAGTLAPQTMDSRADGALTRVSLQDGRRLIAQYTRYAAGDPLCCPSRTTSVVFEVGPDQALVRPVSASTSPNR
jgi:hypothetical protein